MIHELFASELDPHGEIAAAKKSCVLAADAILCNSEHTKQDLLTYFPEVEGRVRVTLLAATIPSPSAAALERAKGFRPYFLYVGGRSSYKNFRSLLAVWKRFAPMHPGIDLRVVGSRWLPHELQELAQSGVQESIVHHGAAADDELPALYRHSIGLVYPSKYEGFGMPPLEAMSCGTAVICARSSSLPEVCGDAALYFDPAQPDSLLAQLQTLVESNSTREECIRRGALQAQQFSWDKTAAQTLDLYRQLTGDKNA
jgi:glycosyltransferase involved in cell wall biosynthesis